MRKQLSAVKFRALFASFCVCVIVALFFNYTQPASSQEYADIPSASLEELGFERSVGQPGAADFRGAESTGGRDVEGGGLVLTVDRTDDDGAASACLAAPNDCSLRGAITAANAAVTADIINFDPTIFGPGGPTRGGSAEGNELPPQTITLGGTQIVLANSGGLTINGPGANLLTVSGGGLSRIINNSDDAVTTISGIRFTAGNGVGTPDTGRGGAIYNSGGVLTLNRVIITGNNSNLGGGGLNNAADVGGGIVMNINDSVISNNISASSGGGIQNFSTSVLNITNCEFSGNRSGGTVGGGGIAANGTLRLTNSTISGNMSPTADGGGVQFNGGGTNSLTLRNNTIAGNSAFDDGGGLFRTGTTSTVNIANNIIALNTNTDGLSPDIGGTFTSLGNNLIGNVGSAIFPAGPGDQIGPAAAPINPMIGPLANNGGPSQTRALLAASTAINNGSNAQALDYNGLPLLTDQRGPGFPRTVGAAVDIGAFEAPPLGPLMCTENFDTVTAPALPAGWSTAATGVELPWVTSTINPDTAPNDAFAPDVSNIGNTELISRQYIVPIGGGQITFSNLFNMEASGVTPTLGFDGMVLEISINGFPYQDIIAAGGSFVTGGYTRTISPAFGSPIAGRMAWSGLSGGTTAAPTYITTTINTPAAANGQIVRFKWRAATDNSAIAPGAAGVRVDTISIPCASLTAAGVELSGRVMTANGNGVTGAIVTVTDQSGVARTTLTSSFGYYRFDDVQVGQTYIVSVGSKRFSFTPRVVQVVDNVSDLDFVAEP